uniref:Uncharacterized protein n=1 Tax=Neobodo designis TaxID=312471 RepID=A0A7S1PMM5_NEODS|mmetsp:Transcript_11080/g.34340  ORF Transcript_11080/g.34340 Transcript_11080/m.34340 type:complete len:121 (+) Transcript_11080:202-564(+)
MSWGARGREADAAENAVSELATKLRAWLLEASLERNYRNIATSKPPPDKPAGYLAARRSNCFFDQRDPRDAKAAAAVHDRRRRGPKGWSHRCGASRQPVSVGDAAQPRNTAVSEVAKPQA